MFKIWGKKEKKMTNTKKNLLFCSKIETLIQHKLAHVIEGSPGRTGREGRLASGVLVHLVGGEFAAPGRPVGYDCGASLRMAQIEGNTGCKQIWMSQIWDIWIWKFGRTKH
jgi:hypothetical protein